MIFPDVPLPPGVRAFTTTRRGGVSLGPYESLNLATHVGDAPNLVRQNRELLRQSSGWQATPFWLNQVHGTTVVNAGGLPPPPAPPDADGAVTTQRGLPLVVMTADCLPVLAWDKEGTVVGAFHAGWKGLLAGVLENGMRAMNRPSAELAVWIGPSIAQASYQVGADVYQAYCSSDGNHREDFKPDGADHWRFDLAGAAARRLRRWGITAVSISAWDTYARPDLFFSHRRSAPCGRMATGIILSPQENS